MSKRTLILLGCLALISFMLLACDDMDMDRSGWGWDGSSGDVPIIPTAHPSDVAAQAQRVGRQQ
jgi:hypothetical protein